jgi:type VI secretion system protein ImpJ
MNNSASMLNYPLQWSEGMLLSPQHFQQNDIYWARQIQSVAALLQPYYWGIDELQIDLKQLAAGILSVTKLRALFKDGLFVDYDSEDETTDPLSLVLKDHMNKDVKTLRIYVNVPIRTEGAASAKSTRRYASIGGGLVADENTGLEAVAISRLKPVLSLSKEKLQDNYTSLPLLEIDSSFDGAYRIGSYIPPLLKISSFRAMGESCLQTRFRKLAIKMRGKAHQLAGITTEKEEGYGAALNEQQAHIIRHMVSNLPSLEVMSAAGKTHPFDAFERLAALSGQLCAIARTPVPPVVLDYDHEDIARGFEQLLTFADLAISAVGLPYSSVVLAEQKNGNFSIPFAKAWLSRRLLLEVTFANNQGKEQVLEWVRHSRIGSSSMLKVLTERRMQGAALEHIERDDKTGIAAKHNSLLFILHNVAVEVDDETMYVIEPEQELQLKGPAGKATPVSIVLHISNEIPVPTDAN